MNYFVRGLLASILVVSTTISPFTFAQTSGDAGTGDNTTQVVQVERESCILPWADYQTFINNKLAYQAAVVDDDYTTAQDIFTMMQESLLTNCNTTASIVDVQAAELDIACLSLVNHLVAKNNFYIRESQVNDAIDTQAVIQTILTDVSCDPVLAGDTQEAVDQVIQEIANTQIDPELSVIPFEENACFMTYGPSQTFTQQINSVNNLTVLDSVYNTVNTYIAALQGVQPDQTQRLQRESVLLQFADTVVQNKRLQWLFGNNPVYREAFTDQLTALVDSLNAIIDHQGWNSIISFISNDPTTLVSYISAIQQYPLWTTYPSIQDILDDVGVSSRTFVWNTQLNDFEEISTDPDTRGWSFVVPGVQEDMTIRFLEIDAVVVYDPVYDAAGEPTQETEARIEITHLVMDIYQGDEKIAALDVTTDYDVVTDAVNTIDFAVYTKPYIFTNHVVTTHDPQTSLDTLSMQINAYGPAGCDIQIDFYQESTPGEVTSAGEAQPDYEDTDLSITIGKTTAVISLTDTATFLTQIQTHRQTVPTATSAPQTAAHVQQAKIYHDNTYIADIFPANDSRRITFTDNPSRSYDLFTEYRDPITTTNPLAIGPSMDVLLTLRVLIQGGDGTVKESDEIYGCTDPAADNYDASATDDDGTCSYSQSGSGDVSGSGDDTGSGDTTPAPTPVYGCTDPAADNYDASATDDNGTCSYPQNDPVVGCPDPGATNYTPGADENDDNNRAMCER